MLPKPMSRGLLPANSYLKIQLLRRFPRVPFETLK